MSECGFCNFEMVLIHVNCSYITFTIIMASGGLWVFFNIEILQPAKLFILLFLFDLGLGKGFFQICFFSQLVLMLLYRLKSIFLMLQTGILLVTIKQEGQVFTTLLIL